MGITIDGTTGITTDIDGDESLTLNRDTSDGDIVTLQKNNSSVGSIGTYDAGYLYIASTRTTDAGLKLGTSHISPSTTTGADRDAAIDLGKSSDRFKNLYLSGGAYLGGTGSANYLDDYEEGTWTATLSDQASGGNTSSTTATGTYTKVGNMVTVYLTYFNISLTGLTSGNTAYVQGLPFGCASDGYSARGYGTLQLNSASSTNVNNMAKVDDGYSSIVMQYGNGSGQTSYRVTDFTHGSVDIFTTITYRTNA